MSAAAAGRGESARSPETFLGGRVIAAQPARGFRSGLDAVVLAAAVPARNGDKLLELGAGAGTASLCLSARVPGIDVAGVEIVPELAALAQRNAAANAMTGVRFLAADIFALPAPWRRDYAHVFCNPPFHAADKVSPDSGRARALFDDGRLVQWLALGLRRTAPGGTFTAILRADRLGQALAALPARGVTALPLWPRVGAPARRVIVQARKDARTPFCLLPGLVLHAADDGWTPEADAILKDGRALALAPPRL